MVLEVGFEPTQLLPGDFKSPVSTYFTIRAEIQRFRFATPERTVHCTTSEFSGSRSPIALLSYSGTPPSSCGSLHYLITRLCFLAALITLKAEVQVDQFNALIHSDMFFTGAPT